MTLGFAFVDGGAYAEEVYKFFQGLALHPEPNVTGFSQASKGVGKHPHPIITRGKMQTIARNLKGRYIGTWQAKDRIYERLRMGLDGETNEGRMHFNKQYSEEFFQGLTVETATQKIEGGDAWNTYKDEVSGNEPLDIEVGCLAAVRLRERNWDTLAEAVRPRESDEPEPEEEMSAYRGRGFHL